MCISIKQPSVTTKMQMSGDPYLYFFSVLYDLNSFQLTELPTEPVPFIPLIWMFPHPHVALPHGMETQ